ncbi:MAG: hypothetical protein ACAI38_09335 [Myxococcota bacterium]
MNAAGGVDGTRGAGSVEARTGIVTSQQVDAATRALQAPEMELLIAKAAQLYPQERVKAENDPSRHLEGGRSVTANAIIGALNAATSPKADAMRDAIKTLLRYQGQLDIQERTPRGLNAAEREDFRDISVLGAGLCSAIASSASDGVISAFMRDFAR